MERAIQQLRDLLRMASLLRDAAGQPQFAEHANPFLELAEVLEHHAAALAGQRPQESKPDPARHPEHINIVT